MLERSLDLAGAVTFWSVPESAASSPVEDGLKAIGLEKFLPARRTPYAAAAQALADVFGNKYLIRPLASRRGITVVREDKGDQENGYDTVATLMLGDDIDLSGPEGHAREAKIRAAYQLQLIRTPGSSLTKSMVDIVKHLCGITLREAGGVYWVPAARLDRWRDAAAVFERAGAKVYKVEAQKDPETVRAVHDAFAAEMQAELDRLAADIDDPSLGEKALITRQQQAVEMLGKIEQYEALLGRALDATRASVAKMTLAATQAAIRAAAA